MLARTFNFVIILSFVFCAVAQTGYDPNVQKVVDFLSSVKTALGTIPSVQNIYDQIPSVQKSMKYVPSIVRKEKKPVSHTTNLLTSLAKDRLGDGYVANYKDRISSKHIAGIPNLIQGATDYFSLWVSDVNNATTTFFRVNKELGLFEIPLYGQSETIGEICMQQGLMYYTWIT
ncbi:uncharacterized protein EV154DRAFT_571621 [Mucor mucedo]|uniref:uncharacterized protein n=1 Tax=Mucor mucedo TaxID=29922 RepID=UPI00221F52F3|nr:uncharacterized protein EV154DRAFT_571621 [Mucor mucedo]KAI7867614.1 hypothetical protein EV154DRAFT_571621 [Mucor mucedo]